MQHVTQNVHKQHAPFARLAHGADLLPSRNSRPPLPSRSPVRRAQISKCAASVVHCSTRPQLLQQQTQSARHKHLKACQASARGFNSCCTAQSLCAHHHDDFSAALHGHSDQHHDEEHGATITDSGVHQVLAWIFNRLGLLQLASFLREKTWNAILISTLMGTALLSTWLGSYTNFPQQALLQLSSAATAVIYVFGGIPELVDLCFDITAGHIDTHVLMTLAVFGTLAIGGALEGALLLVLFQVSHVLEHKLTEQAQGNLQALFDAAPEHATLVQLHADGSPDMAQLHKATAKGVAVGSNMLVRPGEQVALDGKLVYGTAQVSWSHLTGEALPQRVQAGMELPAGTLNHDGLLVVQALRDFQDSTPAQIARLTAQAQASRPNLKRWIDSFGETYSKAIIALTGIILLVLPLLGVPLLASPGQRGALYRAMGFLTTASPCALALVPLAYVSAIGAVTSRGILIQGGKVLDALAGCSTIAFDKTGTLTTGTLACTSMLPLHHRHITSAAAHSASDEEWAAKLAEQGPSEDLTALAAAAALSVRSTHPISQAITGCVSQLNSVLPQTHVDDFRQEPGAGVEASFQKAGTKRWLRFGSQAYVSQGLPKTDVDSIAEACQHQGADQVVSLLVESCLQPAETSGQSHLPAHSSDQEGNLIWLFTFEDTIHQRSAAALEALRQGTWKGPKKHKQKLRVMMLTGDNEATANKVAKQLHIQDVKAGLSPQQKLQAVGDARQSSGAQEGGREGVIMVGDGINDAPALAAADVGIAISDNPTAAAAAAADIIVLSKEGVAAIPLLLSLAHRTQRVLKQNLVLAIGSVLVLALPVVCGFLPLWVAVSFHEGSTLLVALNSLRLLQWRQKEPTQGDAAFAPNSLAKGWQ